MKGRKQIRLDVEKTGSLLFSIGSILLMLFVIFVFCRFSIYRIKGNSMLNTIKPGNTVLIWKEFKHRNAFKKNEIVLFYTEINDEIIPYVKRITAGPMDSIKANSDELIINGKGYPHDEIYYLMSDNAKTEGRKYLTYLVDQSFECREGYNFKTETISSSTILSIPNGCYFLIGDNPYESMDSRFFGLIHEDHIFGKVIVIF
ncbi:MAG: signal peptidase I [Gracilimonas sp.]|uniref:signal peptidase I n=1 Tax=Gracilimonas sp. TaxID=1974203 RepID=UPI003752B7EE|nr:signal peptidase I [Gracilimonas sp.]